MGVIVPIAGAGGGGGGGVPVGVVDSISIFCRNSRIMSSGNVFDRCQISNNFFILSYISTQSNIPGIKGQRKNEVNEIDTKERTYE